MSTAQNPWPPIGQLFVEQGHLTSAQLEGALAEQERTGGRLGEILVERGHISRTDLAGALSKQWSWKNHGSRSIESPAAPMPRPEESVEPEPVAPAPALVPLAALPAMVPPPDVPTFPELEVSAALQWQPSPPPTVAESVEPSAVPVQMEADAALLARIGALEDQEGVVRELQARLRETHEQLAAGTARLGSLETILAQLSQAYAALNARLDAQTREIEDLRRITADQATRMAAAGSALLV